jgi:hypothetical protein
MSMALRIKSRWHDSGMGDQEPKTLADHAGALAFIAWKIALDRAKNLHGEDYVYQSDGQRIAVICEFLAYEVAIADRLVFDNLSYGQREQFINVLGQRVADHVADNARDLFGPGEYRGGFIETLNERLTDYAEFGFGDGGPAYSFNRYLGKRIQSIMGTDQINKWSMDQVMDIDAQEIYKRTRKAVDDLFAGL